jgi:hypothetical protein
MRPRTLAKVWHLNEAAGNRAYFTHVCVLSTTSIQHVAPQTGIRLVRPELERILRRGLAWVTDVQKMVRERA